MVSLNKNDRDILQSLNKVFRNLGITEYYDYWVWTQKTLYFALDEKGYYAKFR